MTEELFTWQDFDSKLSNAFSPATAISRKDFFKGRLSAMRRPIDTVNQEGQHAVIYGERGVGKTSLANVLASFLEPFSSDRIFSHKVNASRDSSFLDIWNAFFRHLEIPERDKYSGLKPTDIVDLMPKDQKVILIVDEFDQIGNPDVDAMFADTIKGLSDFAVDTTLIIVGVADDVDDLVAEHESIDRCFVQVILTRMDMNELRSIVESGINRADMEITPDAVTHICTLAMGLPFYAHSLGLGSGRVAIDRHSRLVEFADVGGAVAELLMDTQQTIYRQFATATHTPRRENTYFQVLLACALAPTDHVGCFRASDVREPYSKIRGSRFEIPAFSKQLHDLCTSTRGSVLHSTGESYRIRFRFTNPMIQPFIIMQGLQRGLIGLPDISAKNI